MTDSLKKKSADKPTDQGRNQLLWRQLKLHDQIRYYTCKRWLTYQPTLHIFIVKAKPTWCPSNPLTII